MTLPTSGPLSIGNIADEFNVGHTGAQSLSMYYAGAGLVPAGTLNGSGAAIPSSGSLDISDFYGSSNITFPVSGDAIFADESNFPSGSTSCSLAFQADGSMSYSGAGATLTHSSETTWIFGTGWSVSNYRFLVVNQIGGAIGTPTHPPIGTAITFPANFGASAGPGQSEDGVYNCQIRTVGGAVLASFTVEVSCDNT
jgi:hypothetical protein